MTASAPDRPPAAPPQPQPRRRSDRRKRRTLFWIAVTLALFAASYPQLQHLSQAAAGIHIVRIRGEIARWGPWGPAASIFLMVVHTFLPLPGEFLLAVNGALFGFWGGLAVSWAGHMISAWIAFELGRVLGTARRPHTVPEKALNWVDQHIKGGDWRVAIVIRFVPLFPISVFNFALGRTSLSLFTFLWTTALGVLPMSAALVAFGYGATGGQDVLPWSVFGLAALIVFGLAYRYRIARPRPGGSPGRALREQA